MPLGETLGAALEATALSQALRASIWLYPLVNTGHVVGIALLFGAIVPLDLRVDRPTVEDAFLALTGRTVRG